MAQDLNLNLNLNWNMKIKKEKRKYKKKKRVKDLHGLTDPAFGPTEEKPRAAHIHSPSRAAQFPLCLLALTRCHVLVGPAGQGESSSPLAEAATAVDWNLNKPSDSLASNRTCLNKPHRPTSSHPLALGATVGL